MSTRSSTCLPVLSDPPASDFYTLSLHDALPIFRDGERAAYRQRDVPGMSVRCRLRNDERAISHRGILRHADRDIPGVGGAAIRAGTCHHARRDGHTLTVHCLGIASAVQQEIARADADVSWDSL